MSEKEIPPGEEINLEAKSLLIISLLILAILALSLPGCKHDPPVPDNYLNNGDDDGGGNGTPCDPNVVYFQQQVLPILVSNCAKSGCHDAASAEEGVILDSYANVMNTGDVTPYNLGNSEIWEAIHETDPDDQMPPPGEPQLTQAQIDLIALWINQGAQDLVCDDNLGPCDSTSVSYSASIVPILQNKCVGCHTTATSTNGFITLTGYADVQLVVQTGQLLGSVTHDPSYAAMPDGGPQLNNCEIAKIRNWINEGANNN